MEGKTWNIPYFASLLTGVLTGLISAHTIFAHSVTAIYFWGFIGLLLGLSIPYPKVRNSGLAYGFTMMISFLLFGFQGKSGSLLGFIALAVGLSFVSAFCGWLVVYIGAKMKSFLSNRKA